jgi:ABC-type nitrate/sulfonate/bicarbonate transport system substrate-binding protein
MRVRTRRLFIGVIGVLSALTVLGTSAWAQSPTKIRYALGDVVGIDDLPLLIAVERAKARGVEVEVTPFKSEEIATQAVINGQADVGQGTPYAALQKVNIPIRFFYQLMTLQFFPIVAKDQYKTWKDLDGQEIAVQGRGSGTEAIMMLAAKQHGIKYKNISYVPGSQVRGLALLKGTIKATILDAPNKSYVMKEAPEKFLILPLGELKASDEALFATTAFLEKNQAAVAVLVEELLKASRAINANPAFAVEERKRLGLLKDLPEKMEAEILPFYQEGVQGGIFPADGGAAHAAANDLEFFALAGQIKGDGVKAEDFWHLGPLKAALAKVGS